MCELLDTLDGPAYIERVALTDAKQHLRARKAVRKALQNQIDGRGFSFVEVLTACPSGWKVPPREAIQWVEKNMIPIFPLKLFRDADRKAEMHMVAAVRKKAPEPETEPASPPVLFRGAVAKGELKEVALTLSGFGGQGVLFAGLALAEGGVREGLEVSWIPSYGPEMRGGTAHCHLRLSKHSIASPWISRPSSLMAFNQPSIEKFAPALLPGGLLLINSSMVTDVPDRADIQIVRVPAYEAAAEMGNAKASNMIMLGAYLEVTRAIEQDSILSAFVENGIRPEMLKSNRAAIEKGREIAGGIRLKGV